MTDVIDIGCITTLDIPPNKVLTKAVGKLETVLIIGIDTEGNEYFASSVSDGGTCVWMIERAKHKLMMITDD
jgi:hypothetical protein